MLVQLLRLVMADTNRKRTHSKKKRGSHNKITQKERATKRDVEVEVMRSFSVISGSRTLPWLPTRRQVAPPRLGGLEGRAGVSGGLGGPGPQRLDRGRTGRRGLQLEENREDKPV